MSAVVSLTQSASTLDRALDCCLLSLAVLLAVHFSTALRRQGSSAILPSTAEIPLVAHPSAPLPPYPQMATPYPNPVLH